MTAAFWNRTAAAYDRAYDSRGASGRFLRARRDAVLDLLGPGPGAVLDFGMGSGRMLAELDARGWRVSGIDASSEMVELARRRLPDARDRLTVASLDELTEHAGRFDAVIAAGVLGDVGWTGDVLIELTRVLHPGGRLVLTVPNRSCVSRRIREVLIHPAARSVKRFVPFGRPAPLRRRPPPSRRSVERMLEAAGLELESLLYAGFPLAALERGEPHGEGSMARRLARTRPARALLARQLVCAVRGRG